MKKLYLFALTAAAATMLFPLSAFAETTITSVDFHTTFEEYDPALTEPTDLIFESDSTEYFLDYECTSSSTTAKNEVTYKLIFTAESGYVFPSSASAVTVNATGVSSITSSSVKDDGEVLEVKVKAYQLMKINEPQDVDESDNKLTWSSDVSGTFEYIIVYRDYDGDILEKKGSTSSKSVSTSSYNKTYSGSKDDYGAREVLGCWVRQKSYSSSSNPYLVPSDWAGYGEEPPETDLDNYECWGDYLGSTDSSTVTKSGSGSSTSTSGSSSGHWSGSNDSGWYYYQANGTLATGWIYTGDRWYWLEPTAGGRMSTGWLLYNNEWYYLNPSTTSGIYGEMLTGWQNVGGYWYYLRPAGTSGTEGAMLENTSVSINGKVYNFNSDGVCTNY